MVRVLFLASILACAAALAPAPTKVKTFAPNMAVVKPFSLAAAATAFSPLAAFAGGQSEGTGLPLGVDDGREGIALTCVFGFFFATYYNWAKDQPDSESDFFGEYDERRN